MFSFDTFNLIFTLSSVFIGAVFLFVILSIISPGFRSLMTRHQLKIQKRVLDDNKDLMKDIGKTTGEIGIDTTRGILEENRDAIEDIGSDAVNMAANVLDRNSDALRNMARQAGTILGSAAEAAGKKTPQVYCKHCGAPIDADSRFCKHCGKEQ